MFSFRKTNEVDIVHILLVNVTLENGDHVKKANKKTIMKYNSSRHTRVLSVSTYTLVYFIM